MSRIVSIGSAVQNIFLIDRDDFVASKIGETSIFGKIEIGEKVDIDKLSYGVGGGGLNSAITFARSGHESILLTNISRDSAGEAILNALDEEGIDSSFLSLSKKPTGCSVILLDAKTGEKTALSFQGSSKNLDNLNLDTLDIISPDWLYVSSLNGNMNLLLALIDKAKKLKIKIMFNPDLLDVENSEKLLGLLPEIDIVILNKKEASKLVPGKILSELASHLKSYIKTFIITDGEMGGFAVNSDESFRFGIYEDIKVKDRTGAGDAFGSGFLSALANGKSFQDSLTFASANATSVLKQIGGSCGALSEKDKLHSMPIQKVSD